MVLVEFSFQETWISQHQMQTLIPKITNLQGKKLKVSLLHSPVAQRRCIWVSQTPSYSLHTSNICTSKVVFTLCSG